MTSYIAELAVNVNVKIYNCREVNVFYLIYTLNGTVLQKSYTF